MEVLIKPIDTNIDKYIQIGIKNFLFPLKGFSVEYKTYFTIDEINEIKDKYSDINIFVSMNKNVFNDELEECGNILDKLEQIGITALFFYDQAFIRMKTKKNLSFDLVWAGTHMVTNKNTCDYYYKNKVNIALVSKEITLNKIIEIKRHSQIKLIVELVSIPSVAFSKRKLVTNYYHNISKENKNSLLIHEKVSNDDYLLIEDKDGVVCYKNSILNGCLALDELIKNNIDIVLLKEDLIESNTFMETVKNVLKYVNNYDKLSNNEKNEFIEKDKNLLSNDTGFFYKETIYKVK